MGNILEYKGYLTKIEYSAEDRVLYGKIEGIRDLVNFESDSLDRIEEEFHCAVDDYLEMCEELGQSPDKAYSGTFNVRIDPAQHKRIAMKAFRDGETLNSAVGKAIAAYVDGGTAQTVEELKEVLGVYTAKPLNVSRANFSGIYTSEWTDAGLGRVSHD